MINQIQSDENRNDVGSTEVKLSSKQHSIRYSKNDPKRLKFDVPNWK